MESCAELAQVRCRGRGGRVNKPDPTCTEPDRDFDGSGHTEPGRLEDDSGSALTCLHCIPEILILVIGKGHVAGKCLFRARHEAEFDRVPFTNFNLERKVQEVARHSGQVAVGTMTDRWPPGRRPPSPQGRVHGVSAIVPTADWPRIKAPQCLVMRSSPPIANADTTKVRCTITYHMSISPSTFVMFMNTLSR